MNHNHKIESKTEKEMNIASSSVSPIAMALGAIAVAGAGYLVWRNRSRIKQFYNELNLGESFGEMGGKMEELFNRGKSEVAGLVSHNHMDHTDNKVPSTGKLHYASEAKVQSAK